MKKKMKAETVEDIAERARDIRWQAENECDEMNAGLDDKAIEDFEEGEVAQYFRVHVKRIIGLFVTNRENIEKGLAPDYIHQWDADTIVRLLSAKTEAAYSPWFVSDLLSDEETIEEWERGTLLFQGDDSVATPTSELQEDVVEAFCEYARAAAGYARHIGSEAAYAYAEILDLLTNTDFDSMIFDPEEKAKHVIELEREGAKRLRLERIIAGLPPYKRARKSAKKRAKKRVK